MGNRARLGEDERKALPLGELPRERVRGVGRSFTVKCASRVRMRNTSHHFAPNVQYIINITSASAEYFTYSSYKVIALRSEVWYNKTKKGGGEVFGFCNKSNIKVNTTEIIDTIENSVYAELKPLGFRRHGRTLHRFVDGDISQIINFQCGQSYRNETHLMWVNIGIRVPECVLHAFHSDEPQKIFYHEYECNIRSCLGTIKNKKQSCYDLRRSTERITADIMEQIRKYVLPAFDVLNTRDAILKERRNYKRFDVTNGHLICLEEAMMYGKMEDVEKAAECFNRHYKKYLFSRKPNVHHLQYLKELAEKLNIPLET